MSHLRFDDMKVEIVEVKTNRAQRCEKLVPQLLPMPQDLMKQLSSDLQLSILLDRRNNKWRSSLEEKIISNYGSIYFGANLLTIKCTLDKKLENFNELASNWEKRMNSVISGFSNQFCMESINLDDNESSTIRDAIREFNQYNGYSIDYRIFKKRLFYVIKKSQLIQFQNSIVDIAHEKCKNLDYFIPTLPDKNYYLLIKPLIGNLKLKFRDIESISYTEETNSIQLRGPAKRLDEILIQICDSISKIRSDKLSSISDEVIKCNNLTKIVQKIIDEKNLFCKLIKKTDGLYLIYFLQKESSFLQLENLILQNYTSTTIDCSMSSDVLSDVKWTDFKTKNLLTNHDLTFRLVNSKELMIFGKKEILFELENKVQEFLGKYKNEKPNLSKKLDFDQNEVSRQVYI